MTEALTQTNFGHLFHLIKVKMGCGRFEPAPFLS